MSWEHTHRIWVGYRHISVILRQLTFFTASPPPTQGDAFDSTSTNPLKSYLPRCSCDALHANPQSPPRVTPRPSLPLLRWRRVFPQVLHTQTSLRETMATLLTGYSLSTLRRRISLTRNSQRAGKETRKGSSSLYFMRPYPESAPLTWFIFSDRSLLCHGGGVHHREL